jgi:hypothetical protein
MKDYNFKARCIDNRGIDWAYTIGRVYEIKDGTFKSDNKNYTTSYYRKLKNINELNEYSFSTFELVEDENKTIVIYQKDNEVIANLKEGKTIIKSTKVKCCPTDQFDFNIGAKIAFNRLIGDEENNTYKEVKRSAKVGEWIKIVDANLVPVINGKPDYKNGDVLNIINSWYGTARYAKGYSDDGYNRVVNDEEYVVLEGYQPKNNTKLDLSTVSDVELLEEIQKRMKNNNIQ